MRSRLFLRRPRGSTLVVAITLAAVLTVVAAGLIHRGNTQMEAASARRHYDTSVACADGARELLLSQFRAFGVDLSQLRLDQKVGSRRYASGHYDTFGVTSVEPVDRTSIGASSDNAIDLSNRAVRIALGGAYYRITVVCSDSEDQDRQSEVEFLMRFGL